MTEVVVSEIQFLKSKGNNEQNYTESLDLFGAASIDISDEALPF